MRCCPTCHRVWAEENEYCPSDGRALEEITDEHDPLVGVVLDNRYELEEILGAGGMGFVYLAKQRGLSREVAVKMLYAERTRDRRNVRRFRREAIALAGIDHPNVVRVLEYGDGGGDTPYIVMEKVGGLPLDDIIAAIGRFPPRHAIAVAAQLADALSAAHRAGVVHRDLKPANVQIDAQGKDLHARILDFGLALLAEGIDTGGTGGGRLTRQGMIFGTPEYMSPEQIKGRNADSRSDIYSLGIVLYELLTGTPPFIGVTNAAVLGMHIEDDPAPLDIPDLDAALVAELDRAVRSLLEKNPDDRPQDASVLAAELRTLEKRLPDPGPAANLLASPGLGTEALGAVTEELAQPTQSGPMSERPFDGLTMNADADRALASALGARERTRRVRMILGGLVALVLVSFGVTFALAKLRADSEEDSPVVATSDGEAASPGEGFRVVGRAQHLELTKMPRGDLEGSELMPGGAVQEDYEGERRALETMLAQRGLRFRDLKHHAQTRLLYASQDENARAGEYAAALADIRELTALAQSIPAHDFITRRMRAVERDLGDDPTPVQLAQLNVLKSRVPPRGAPRDAIRAFMVRIDRLEDTMREDR